MKIEYLHTPKGGKGAVVTELPSQKAPGTRRSAARATVPPATQVDLEDNKWVS